jgi:acyl phosphate:glycerol-3-phosphate acyltransferase
VIPLLLLVLAYVLGATPTSYWVGRVFHGVDLRTVGSGNLGATNTFRVLGWRAALPVMLVDILKGWAPVALFPLIPGAPPSPLWILAFGAAAIVGHVYSFWVGFRGGKGVATSAGVFMGLAPWAVLIAFVVWVGLVFATRMVSAGSIAAAVVLPLAVLFTPTRGGTAVIAFSFLLSFFVIFAHRANIRRLLRGEEHRFGRGVRLAGRADHSSPPKPPVPPAGGGPAAAPEGPAGEPIPGSTP